MLTRDELISIMKDGKLVSVKFIKKNGEERNMTARLGVTSHLHGGTKPYDDKEKNLLSVFDMNISQYRSIPLDRVLEVKKSGEILYSEGR